MESKNGHKNISASNQQKNKILQPWPEVQVYFTSHILSVKQKFGFIKRVDKGCITTVKDLESWRFEP